jgi:hypothetical protein
MRLIIYLGGMNDYISGVQVNLDEVRCCLCGIIKGGGAGVVE